MPRKRKAPRVIIIAGPNGAGKTTFAKEFLTHEAGCPDFINVDLYARGISPFAPEKAAIAAGKLVMREMEARFRRRESFAFETTLAGLNYARHIRRWRKAGYVVSLIFLTLPTADVAVARVKARAAQGGHDVPEGVVRRRFESGLRNFREVYSRVVNDWAVYNNKPDEFWRLMDSGVNP